MDGLTLLDRLRASSVDERIRGLRAGSDDHPSKPFATAELRPGRGDVVMRSPIPEPGDAERSLGSAPASIRELAHGP